MRPRPCNRDSIGVELERQVIGLDLIGTLLSLLVFEDQKEDSSESNVSRSKETQLNQAAD